MLKPLALAAALLIASTASAQPLTTAFTFQGRLDSAGAPATGTYDLRFTLFDAPTAGAQVGPQLCVDNVSVANGLVTVQLDFGSQFTGSQRYLEVQTRQDTGLACGNGTGFTTLSPRQNLSAAPNADFSLTAATAVNAAQLGGQPASFYTNAANLTGTLPSASLVGAYSGALTLANSSNIFAGNGASLINLNATNVSLGTLSDFRLSSNVAFLSGGQAFTGAKSFTSITEFDNAVNFVFGGRILTVRNDSGLVPGLDLTGSSGNIGILRVRNRIEMWPNDAGTTAASIDLRDAAGAPQLALDGGTGTGQFNGELVADNAGRNSGTVANSLRLGSPTSGETIASKRNSGGNQFGLDLFTNSISRLSITNAGNVGIGTSTPAARLDVNGAIRSSGGIVFPDGSTQYRADAALDTPLVTSGLPGGSTFVVTVNGTTATLATSYSVNRPIALSGGQYLVAGSFNMSGLLSPRFRRQRTADATWATWTTSGTTLPVSMVLTVSGATVTWSANMTIVSLHLVAEGGIVYEELELFPQGGVNISRVVAGAPAVLAPSSDAPGLTFNYNGTPVANSVGIVGTGSLAAPVDLNGNITGARDGATIQVRCNPFSGAVLRANFIGSPFQSGAIVTSGTTWRSSPRCLVNRYTLRVADDGLPIEEYNIQLDPT
jgi:hypothetical protein